MTQTIMGVGCLVGVVLMGIVSPLLLWAFAKAAGRLTPTPESEASA